MNSDDHQEPEVKTPMGKETDAKITGWLAKEARDKKLTKRYRAATEEARDKNWRSGPWAAIWAANNNADGPDGRPSPRKGFGDYQWWRSQPLPSECAE